MHCRRNKWGILRTFFEKQFAVTKGQSCVVYDGDTLVMGGVIEKVIK